MATFEKLIENAKAEMKLRAEREAEARAPRVAGRVSQPYAVVRGPLSHRQPTLEAPCIPMSTDYVAPAVADADTYHQRLNGSGVARTYSLEQADWLLRPALVSGADFKRISPKAVLCSVTASRQIVDERPNPKVNPGRVAEVRSKPRGPLSDNDCFAVQASRKVQTLAVGPGRGAEMRCAAPRNIAARPVAPAASARVAPFDFVEKVGAVKGWNVWRSARASGLTGYVIVSKSGTVLSIINDAASFVVFAQIWGAVGQ